MNIIHISATNLKRDIANILNDVYFSNKTAIVERHGKVVAKIVPVHVDEVKNGNDTDTLLNKYFGIIPDFPEIKKERKFRKKHISL